MHTLYGYAYVGKVLRHQGIPLEVLRDRTLYKSTFTLLTYLTLLISRDQSIE